MWDILVSSPPPIYICKLTLTLVPDDAVLINFVMYSYLLWMSTSMYIYKYVYIYKYEFICMHIYKHLNEYIYKHPFSTINQVLYQSYHCAHCFDIYLNKHNTYELRTFHTYLLISINIYKFFIQIYIFWNIFMSLRIFTTYFHSYLQTFKTYLRIFNTCLRICMLTILHLFQNIHVFLTHIDIFYICTYEQSSLLSVC
jgi:hypothetical protein